MSGSAPLVTASVLHRLMNPAGSENGLSLRDHEASVRRDLQTLLNARRPWASVPKAMPAVRDSMYAFGLPDYAAGAFNHAQQRQELCKEIALAIQRFEPRLRDVKVTPIDRSGGMDPVLRIRIQASLAAEEATQPVVFDTFLDATTADLAVGPGGRV